MKMVRRISGPTAMTAGANAIKSEVYLTFELWDGSRVMATGLDDTLSLHSAEAGDMKLPWESIRSISWPNADSNTAFLIETDGKLFQAQLSMQALNVQTVFGKAEMKINLIRQIRVSTVPPSEPPRMPRVPLPLQMPSSAGGAS